MQWSDLWDMLKNVLNNPIIYCICGQIVSDNNSQLMGIDDAELLSATGSYAEIHGIRSYFTNDNQSETINESEICVVTFDAQGGQCKSQRLRYASGKTFASLPTPYQTGFVFLGWFDAVEGGKLITESSLCLGSQTLYARWSRSVIDKGSIENTLDWTLYSDGLLDITMRKGRNNAYDWWDVAHPWSVRIRGGNDAYRSRITEVNLPENLTGLPYNAFLDHPNLYKIYIPSTIQNMHNGSLFQGCVSLLTAGPVGSGCNIEYGWTNSIPAYAFANSELESVIIPETVITIGNNAFSFCESLASINIPENVTRMGWSFQKCKSLATAGAFGSGCNIEFGWKDSIPENAFAFSEVIEADIPDGIKMIGENAFQNDSVLRHVSLPQSLLKIGSHAFSLCTSLQSITIPDGVTEIGGSTFFKCANLTHITIPGNVTDGGLAFHDCTGLVSVKISEGVKKIAQAMFDGCTNLNTITIPVSATQIVSAFTNCSNITDIYYAGNEEQWTQI